MPVYGCDCARCLVARSNRSLQRTPCSALLEFGDRRLLLDAGQVNLPERFPVGTLDAILLTHFHPDHVQGLFHLRWGSGIEMPVYCPPDSQGCADLFKHPGILRFTPGKKFTPFHIAGMKVTPVPLIHSRPTYGYVFEADSGCLAYLTDTKGLPDNTLEFLIRLPVDVMVIDCSFRPGDDRKGHNDLAEVLELHDAIAPRQTVLTHIGHDFDVWLERFADTLPHTVLPGYDGMVITTPHDS
jgi:phosphoribosyl 1,2-cyclic phosphate phosphodiesterase